MVARTAYVGWGRREEGSSSSSSNNKWWLIIVCVLVLVGLLLFEKGDYGREGSAANSGGCLE